MLHELSANLERDVKVISNAKLAEVVPVCTKTWGRTIS